MGSPETKKLELMRSEDARAVLRNKMSGDAIRITDELYENLQCLIMGAINEYRRSVSIQWEVPTQIADLCITMIYNKLCDYEYKEIIVCDDETPIQPGILQSSSRQIQIKFQFPEPDFSDL